MSNNTLNNTNQTTYNVFIQLGFILRVFICPILEILGGLNNFLIILIITPSLFSKKTNYSTNASGHSLKLSKSSIIYFNAIALTETAVLWSSVFQRGWINDIFKFDPTAINSITCKIYQFIFFFFLLYSSW